MQMASQYENHATLAPNKFPGTLTNLNYEQVDLNKSDKEKCAVGGKRGKHLVNRSSIWSNLYVIISRSGSPDEFASL